MRTFVAVLLAAPFLVLPAGVNSAPTVSLPDTGIFAPVASQYRARLARLDTLARGLVTPERIRLLIDTGQPDEAQRLLSALSGEPREAAVARARLLITRQSFDEAIPTLAALEAEPAPTDAERSVVYAWLNVREDAARIDSLTRRRLAAADPAGAVPEWLAAGRLAYDRLDYARAESCFTAALAGSDAPGSGVRAAERRAARSAGNTGLALVLQKRRDWDGSLVRLQAALAERSTSEVLVVLTETLIRLGRTDDAISAGQWAVRLNPYHDASHYLLGNGYARKNYTQLVAAYPDAFAGPTGRAALARADSLLAAGRRIEARAAYERFSREQPTKADGLVRLASLDFEDGRFDTARDRCFHALGLCPEYGRAHAVLAKALEAQRFDVDVHRADYERRFAAAPMPRVPGIERFVRNWRSLSPRHQKRVALSIAPWKAFVPVLVEGGATYYIKPLYMRLSDCPALEPLRDQRISYDSRLWDDVRGCGGYHTVTGIEDVERTIFDRYNTVLHELTHQVHGVLPADDSRAIQERYRLAKARDDSTRNGFLSRYAGGSVFEYFAEGANALASPRRDAYDPREVVRERLDALDPELKALVMGFLSRSDVSGSYAIAYAAGGDDRAGRGRVSEAIRLYRKALRRQPNEETAMISLARAYTLGNRRAEAESSAAAAVRAHPTSGPAHIARADAAWHAGRGLAAARRILEQARPRVRPEDRWQIDSAIGRYAWCAGDTTRARSAYDSVLAYQSDSPDGLQGRAAVLALEARWDTAFAAYDQAVRMRTGIVDLRCDLARELLRAGRVDAARSQLAEAALLDEENATAEALRGWVALAKGDRDAARRHVKRALEWGPWSDLARIVLGAIEKAAGNGPAAAAAWAAVEQRIARDAPPEYVYRPKLAVWEEVHVLPAVERSILATWRGR